MSDIIVPLPEATPQQETKQAGNVNVPVAISTLGQLFGVEGHTFLPPGYERDMMQCHIDKKFYPAFLFNVATVSSAAQLVMTVLPTLENLAERLNVIETVLNIKNNKQPQPN